jgi:hypothetical protein
MPAFDKNSVQTDHAYNINPIDIEDVQLQSCPRCGALAERRHRNVCLSCKRHIPPVSARQKWDTTESKNAFANISPLVVREKQQKQHKFDRIKKDSFDIASAVRNIVVVVAVGGAIYFGTVPLGTAIFGKTKMKDVQQEVAFIMGKGQPKDITAKARAH